MTLDFELQETTSGLPTVVVRQGEAAPVWLHSRYHPSQEGEELAATVDLADAGLVLVLGLGLGYHVCALAERAPNDTLILVIEKHPEIFQSLQSRTSSQVLPPNVIVMSDIEKIKWFVLRNTTARARYGMVHMENKACVQLDPTFYRRALEEFRDAIRMILVNAGTTQDLGHWFGHNLVANLSHMVIDPPAGRLDGILKGSPAVTVASGPSLSKNIHHLRGLRGRVPIIAAGSAYEALLNAGIIPDFVVGIDPQPENMDIFLGRERDDVCLVYESSFYSPAISLFHGPRYYGFSNVHHRTFVADLLRRQTGTDAPLPSGGTVASTAFALAGLMGADPIIIVGQDLAFTDGWSHASGLMACAGEVPVEELPEVIVSVPAVDGGSVKTSLALFACLRHLQEQYKAATDRGITVIDATEGGALKQHTVVMPLKEALGRYATCDVDAFALIHADYHAHSRQVSRVDKSVRKIRNMVKRLEHLEGELTTGVAQIMKIQRATRSLESGRLGPHAGMVATKVRAIFNDFCQRQARIAREKDLMQFLDVSMFLPFYGRRHKNVEANEKLELTGMYYLEMINVLRNLLSPLKESLAFLEDKVKKAS